MRARLLTLLLLLLLVTTACRLFSTLSSESTQHSAEMTPNFETDKPTSTPPTSGEIQEMNCKDMGLPCTPDEVDPEVMDQGLTIYQELKTRLENGENIDNLRVWLEDMDAVRVVLSNSVGVMFILEGGLPLGVYDATLAGGREGARTGVESLSKVSASPRPPFIPNMDVVGEGTERENEKRHKQALILSPFDFEFNIPDAGARAAAILGGIPDYKNRVTHLIDGEVDIDAFRNWDKYDLILYNGHGGTMNGRDKKTGKHVQTSFITTGAEQLSCDLQSTLKDIGLMEAYAPSIMCIGVKVRVENVVGRAEDVYQDYLAINPLFFTTEYTNGLEKAVIIFNGCVTFVSKALPSRLAGNNSVFFGWDNDVLSNFNPGVISNLLSELAEGHPSEKAYDKICQSSGCVDTAGKGAKLQRFEAGDDLRIREIAISLHPFTGDPLTDGDKVPVYGYPGDGQVDELPFYIEVMAVEFEEIKDYTIRFEVNGQEIQQSWKINDPEAVEKWEAPDLNTYRILDRMVLPFDFQQDQEIKLVIRVELPEGGESKSVTVKPLTRNPVLSLESWFRKDENGGSIGSIVSAEVPMSLLEINEDMVKFESLERPELLQYDAFEVTVPNCDVKPQTTNGSINVFQAIFPKDGFSNIQVPIPEEFTFAPTNDITEMIALDCAGSASSIPYTFWYAAFAVANEERFTENGIQITDWSQGSGDIYAEFHWQSETDELEGEYSLQIREP